MGTFWPIPEWLNFWRWRAEQAVGPFKGVRYSATMEESLRSEDVGRVHVMGTGSLSSTGGLLVRPNCAVNYLETVGSSSADRASCGRGAAYALVYAIAHFEDLWTRVIEPVREEFVLSGLGSDL